MYMFEKKICFRKQEVLYLQRQIFFIKINH